MPGIGFRVDNRNAVAALRFGPGQYLTNLHPWLYAVLLA
jgi:hypothetical protein